MDIRQLKYFKEVSKQLNFTRAAVNLHVSQPSLSKTIKNMEEILNTKLFYRSSKKLKLTDEGEVLLENSKKVLYAYDLLRVKLDDITDGQKGSIKIGIPPIIGAAFCSEIISLYVNSFPSIKVKLDEVGSNKILEDLDDGNLDVGFICRTAPHKYDFTSMNLLKDPLMVLINKNHPFKAKEEIKLTDLFNQPLIMYRRDFSLYQYILNVYEDSGFEPNIVCESSQKDFIINMVSAELGIALLPRQIALNIKRDNIIAVPLFKNPVHLHLNLIWKSNDYIPMAVQEFISVTKQYIQKQN